jgi:hypothetical protein
MHEDPTAALRRIRDPKMISIASAARMQNQPDPEETKIMDVQTFDQLLPLCRNAITGRQVSMCYSKMRDLATTNRNLPAEKLDEAFDTLRGKVLQTIDEFSPECFCSLMSAFGRYERRPDAKLLRLVQSRIIAMNGNFNAGHVASILWSYASWNVKPDETLWKALEGRVLNTISTAWSRNIATLLWSCATLSIQPEERTYAAMTNRLLEVKTFIRQRELYDMLWANSRLRIPMPKPVIDVLSDKLSENAHMAELPDIIGVLLGFARSRAHPGEQTFHTFCERVHSSASTLTPYRTSHLVYAFSKLGLTPPESMLVALGERALVTMPSFSAPDVSNLVHGWLKLNPPSIPGLMDATEMRMIEVMPDFIASDVANIIWAYGYISTSPKPETLKALSDHVIKIQDRFTEPAVCNVMASLSRMKDAHIAENLFSSLGNRLLKGISNLMPHHFCNALLAYGKLGYSPCQNLLDAFTEFCESRVSEFTPRDVSTTMLVHATLRVRPSEAAMDKLALRLEKVVWDLRAPDLVSMMQSYDKLGLLPSERLQHVLHVHVCATARSFRHSEIAELLLAYAKCGVSVKPEVIEALCERVRFRATNVTHDDLLSVTLGFAAIGVPPNNETLNALSARFREIAPSFSQEEVSAMRERCAKLQLDPDCSFCRALAEFSSGAPAADSSTQAQSYQALDAGNRSGISSVNSSLSSSGDSSSGDSSISVRAQEPVAGGGQAQDRHAMQVQARCSANDIPEGSGEGRKEDAAGTWIDPQLMQQDIKSAEDLETLLQLCSAQDNDAERLSQIYHRVRHMTKHSVDRAQNQQFQRVLDTLRPVSMARITSFAPRHLTMLMMAYAVGRIMPDEELNMAISSRIMYIIQGFSSRNAANALWSYAKLGLYPELQVQEALLKRFLIGIRETTPFCISNTVWALGRLQIHPGDRLLVAICNRIVEMVDLFSPQNVSNTLWGFARLGAKMQGDEAGVLALRDRAHVMLRDLNEHGVMDTIWAYGELGVPLTEDHVHALRLRVRAGISQFRMQDACTILWFYAKLGFKPDYVPELTAKALSALSTMGTRQLSTLLWSYAKLHIHPGDEIFESLAKRVEVLKSELGHLDLHQMIAACKDLGVPQTHSLSVTLASCVDKAASANNGADSHGENALPGPASLSRNVFKDIMEATTFEQLRAAAAETPTCERISLAYYKCRSLVKDKPAYHAHAHTHATEPLHAGQEEQEYSLFKAKRTEDWELRVTMQFLEKLVTDKLQQFTSRHMAMMLTAYAHCNVHPNKAWLAELTQQMLQNSHVFTYRQISNVLWAFAQLRVSPGDAFLHTFTARLLNDGSPSIVQSMCSVLWSYASLGVVPPEKLLSLYISRILMSPHLLDSVGLAHLIWSMGVFNHHPGKRTMNTLMQHLESMPIRPLHADKVSEVMWALATLRVPPPDGLRRALDKALVSSTKLSGVDYIVEWLWAHAMLGMQVNPEGMRLLERQMSRWKDIRLRNKHVLMMLAAYRHMPELNMSDNALAMIMNSLRAFVWKASAKELAESLRVVSELQLHVHTELHKPYLRAIRREMSAFDHVEILQVLTACAKLNITLPKYTTNALIQLLVTKMSIFRAEDVCKTFMWLSSSVGVDALSARPIVADLVAALQQHTEQLAGDFTHREAVDMICAWTALGLQPTQWMNATAEAHA